MMTRDEAVFVDALSTMDESKLVCNSKLVRPDERDILIGRGNSMYNFIGNRRFRKLVDMFIQEYVESNSRRHKSTLVRTVIDIAQRAGYRFLKRDRLGIFAELSHCDKKLKVGIKYGSMQCRFRT